MADKEQRPIGWYLKEVDALITKQVNATLAQKGLNRVEWQILKSIADNGFIVFDDFLNEVKHFVNRQQLSEFIDQLEKREWVENNGDKLILTTCGKAAFKEIDAIQMTNRLKIAKDISEADYQTTVKVLAQMVNNLST